MSGDHDEPLVLVDARNVIRSRWPNFREEHFLELTRRWAANDGVALVLVFDGRAPGGVLGREDLDARTALVGTGGESADDWIAREAAQLAAAGRHLRLVSSDRKLRDRAFPYVVELVGGGTFARLLEALEHER